MGWHLHALVSMPRSTCAQIFLKTVLEFAQIELKVRRDVLVLHEHQGSRMCI